MRRRMSNAVTICLTAALATAPLTGCETSDDSDDDRTEQAEAEAPAKRATASRSESASKESPRTTGQGAATADPERIPATSVDRWRVTDAGPDGKFRATIGTADDQEWAPLREAFRERSDERGRTTIDYDNSLMPPDLRDMERVDVLTTAGVETLPVEDYWRGSGVGSPAEFALVLTAPEEGSLPEFGSIAAPAGEFDGDAAIRSGEGCITCHEEATVGLRRAFLRRIDENERERIRELTGTDIVLMEGDFPGEHHFVGVVGQGLHALTPAPHALVFTDDSGNVTGTVFEPTVARKSCTLAALGDPDDDGVEGILVRSSSQGGDRVAWHWLTFSGGAPSAQALPGSTAR